jgi:ferredoxin
VPESASDSRSKGVLERRNLSLLFEALTERGHRIIGPTIKARAIVYGEIASPEELPAGWTGVQEPGSYRLERRGDAACFGFAAPAQSLRPFFQPPGTELWKAERRDGSFTIEAADGDPPAPCAFIGARACDLAALAIHDRVFTTQPYVDSHYRARRDSAFIVGVNCTRAGGTCFCASMGTGPRLREGFDLALTEIYSDDRHEFLVEAGTDAGEEVMGELELRAAGADDISSSDALSARAAASMGRRLDTNGLKEILQANLEHPHWDEVAKRCLACGNCTMACPTCFCTDIEDSADLTGKIASRSRRWDSCYSIEYSYIHGGSIRTRIPNMYRHWLTHKLANWHDQFGVSGCVGCGRCITWCPPGIDLTEEVRAIRESGARNDEDRAKEASHGNA